MPLICLGCVRCTDVSQRPFRSLSRWLSLQEWHVYGVAPMAFYPRQPPLLWFECGEEKAMNLLEVWGSWCQISSHPFTETCRTSSVFTFSQLSQLAIFNIPTCNPRLFGFWHALPSCMSQYYTHMLHNKFPQTTHIPLNKSCLNCGRMHLIWFCGNKCQSIVSVSHFQSLPSSHPHSNQRSHHPQSIHHFHNPSDGDA